MNLNTQVEVNDQAGDRGKPISASSFDAYICALMDLWKTQHELGRNPVVPIRPSSVKTMQKAKKIAQVSQEDLEFADRGIGTIADRVKLKIDDSSFQEISDSFFLQDSECGLWDFATIWYHSLFVPVVIIYAN